MTLGELFAGIGGFSLAAQRTGWRLAWAVEIDPFAQAVYRRHFPEVPLYDDVRDFVGTPVDCITAGFPCQDVSQAGSRKGLGGERSGLFYEIVRIARGLQPRWLLLENVPGLLYLRQGRDFGTVIAALDELGYGLAWRVLDAQFFGIPQTRRRVFIVGYLGAPCPSEILFESDGMSGDSPSRRTDSTITGADSTGVVGVTVGGGSYVTVLQGVAPTLTARHSDRTSVFVMNDGRVRLRRFTPLEWERLQGFPDNWTLVDDASDQRRYHALGNAVAVPVVEWILRRIMAWENGNV